MLKSCTPTDGGLGDPVIALESLIAHCSGTYRDSVKAAPFASRARPLATEEEFTPEDDQLLLDLTDEAFTWPQILLHFPGRNVLTMKYRYRILKPPELLALPQLRSKSQKRYTRKDDELLVYLKEDKSLTWSYIATYFPGRTMRSLREHYPLLCRRIY